MSIKIYTAYRIPLGRLKEFQDLVSKQCFEQTSIRVETFLTNLRLIKEFVDSSNNEEMSQNEFTWYMFKYLEYEIFKPQGLKQEKSLFNLDCSLNLWLDRDFVYIIPYLPQYMFYTLVNLEYIMPVWVEDYSYWNNGDQPEDVTEEEWDMRYENWKKVCLTDWNKYRLEYQILDSDCIDHMYKLEKMIIGEY